VRSTAPAEPLNGAQPCLDAAAKRRDGAQTDLVNGLPGTHQLRLTIDTFSDAEGIVSGSAGEWIGSLR
jgi:hypothetical protein